MTALSPTLFRARARGQLSPDARWAVGLVGLALLAAAPLFLRPNIFAHSAVYNVAWQRLVSDAVAGGTLWPRWLPGANHGFGGPSFYFYPPLPFELGALIDLATGRRLEPLMVVDLASAVFLAASGLSMFAWLRDRGTEPRTAGLAAAAYLLAPYHLIDLYIRAAVGEAAAYAFLPLVALGLGRLARGARGGTALVVVGYAGLLYSHLPTALLASVTLIPMQTGWLALRRPEAGRLRFLLTSSAAAGTAVLLAAPFLLTAVSLQNAVLSQVLWSDHFVADRWRLLFPRQWTNPATMLMMGPLEVAAALAAVALLWAGWRRRAQGARRDAEALFWASAALVCVLLASGAVPGVWSATLLAKVQFPWRLLALSDFALVAAVALASPELRRAVGHRVIQAVAVVAFIGVCDAGLLGLDLDGKERTQGAVVRAQVEQDRREPNEYLPAGFSDFHGSDPLAPSLRLPWLRAYPLAETASGQPVKVTELPVGGLRVLAERPGERILLRRFAFPSWRVTRADGRVLATEPYGPARRLSFIAPRAGVYIAAIVPLPAERIGWRLWAVGAAGLLLALGLALRPRQNAPRRFTSEAPAPI